MLIYGRLEIVNAGNFDIDGNSVFTGDDLLIDVGPAAAVIELKMDLQASVRIARGALKPGLIAGQNKRVPAGLGGLRRGSRSSLGLRQRDERWRKNKGKRRRASFFIRSLGKAIAQPTCLNEFTRACVASSLTD